MINNVIEFLKNAANLYPDKIAFCDDNSSITFKELDIKARKFAAMLHNKINGEINQPIAVFMKKSIECIIGFMGIVYSGNYYSPLDINSPKERIRKIMDTLHPRAIIYDKYCLNDIFIDYECIDYEDSINYSPEIFLDNIHKKVLNVDPLYVLFTSGSTGFPKGVVISHQSVIDYIEWLNNKIAFDAETIIGNQASLHFDLSVQDIYLTLRNGLTTMFIPERLLSFPNQLLAYITEKKINTVFWIPSLLINIANSGALEKKSELPLQKVLFCGEVMPTKQLNIWKKHFPDITYVNMYGPTEVTVACTMYIVDRHFSDEELLPIGNASDNSEIIVLNEEHKKVQIDEIGELCVRGCCLSLGYFNNWDKSSESFIQNPLNNNYRDLIYCTGDLVKYNNKRELIYLGRKDFQIKHQGFRIELSEIESMAYGYALIQQCCAIYDHTHKRIVLYCVINGQTTEKEIYIYLKKMLPIYMLPGKIVIEDELPLNNNGKINRIELERKAQDKII